MNSYDVLLEQVRDTVSAIQQLTDTAFEQYSTLTDAVAAGEIREQQEIERIMDGLIVFGDDGRFLEIYKKLCCHVYYKYPDIVGEHVALWRLQFEEADEGEMPEDLNIG